MKVTPTISLEDMATILRDHLSSVFNADIDTVIVESYDAPKIIITYANASGSSKGAMVDCCEFKHKA